MKFISREHWEAVVDGLDSNRDVYELRRRLIEDADGLVNRGVLSIGGSNIVLNLYVFQNAFLELSLAYRLTRDEKYKHYLVEFCKSIAAGRWLCAEFPWEIHWGYLLSGIAVAADLMKDGLEESEKFAVLTVAQEVGDHIWRESGIRAWGQKSRSRNAWNHTVIPFAALGVAGILLRELKGSRRWARIGRDRVRAYLLDGLTDAGANWEGLYYLGFVMRVVALFLRACLETHCRALKF